MTTAASSSFTIGKPGILWKLDRQTGQFIGHKETVFQNIFDSIDPKTGTPTYRGDIIEAKVGQWIPACPSTQGGQNWHSTHYHPGSNLIIIPLSQSCLEIVGPPGGVQGRIRRHAGRSPLVRDAGHRRQDGQVRGLRRADDARGVELTSSARRYLRRRSPPAATWRSSATSIAHFRAFDVRTGRVLWQTRLGTSVQGFPISFAANGKQYIAVTTGLGGGSPRNVPRLLLPESGTRITGNCALRVRTAGVEHEPTDRHGDTDGRVRFRVSAGRLESIRIRRHVRCRQPP